LLSSVPMPTTASGAGLLVIDVVNPFEFDGADALYAHALPAARRIAALTARARDAGIPTIYVNDNFDCWHLGFRELITDVRGRSACGRAIADVLAPEPSRDHYVLKPMHSGFFATGLEVLIQRLGLHTLILTGVAADICVLFTANDAYMRGYRVVVPADCVAAEHAEDCARALRQMSRLLKADVRPSAELDLDALARRAEA
jgi:nicotinamidase-related amidase